MSTASTSAGPLIPLRRPEYVSSPELLISSLAWNRRSMPDLTSESGLPIGLAYRTDKTSSRTIEFRSTAPDARDVALWGDALMAQGIDGGLHQQVIGTALANSVEGVRPRKSTTQGILPLSPSMALLQNARGMLGKRNPPDLGEILETCHELGGGEYGEASAGWFRAVGRRLQNEPILSALDNAFATRLPAEVVEIGPGTGSAPGWSLPWSPFAWFVDAWAKLTSDAWVDALPARRWNDWATTVLRNVIGFGFLWEASWHEQVARAVLVAASDEPVVGELDRLTARTHQVVPWFPAKEAVSVRDVAGKLKSLVARGAGCRAVLADHDVSGSVAEAVPRLAVKPEVVDGLRAAFRPAPRAGSNIWEAVKYALLARERVGDAADHYGFFESRGRYLLPAPATEWIAVVASLTASGPGQTTTLGDVIKDLHRMGLDPHTSAVLALLEAAGLARGAADADQSVEVHTAY